MINISTAAKLWNFIVKTPSYAAISGGWLALFKSACIVLSEEGVGGFFLKINRLLDPTKITKENIDNPINLDLTRFSREEGLQIIETLKFEDHAHPRVSIIIPVHNQFQLTIECLSSIARHIPETSFELLLINDASTDEAIARMASISGLKYLSNEHNIGYLHSCNRALRHARGNYIHLLNNDTQVQANWLDPLVSRLDNNSDIGIVGSKLLCIDGRLQEAGARLIRSNDGAKIKLIGELIGLGASALDPCYAFAREVEYCSGASLLVRSDLLLGLGGLDPRYAPAYFEDVDLAYSARKAGYRAYYEPRSEIVHHLSASTSSGKSNTKTKLVEKNGEIFLKKWESEFKKNQKIRPIAFFLPQFHPIRENDAWWGKGFTEWSNVTKAQPNFAGHYQPHFPTELGYYDLRVHEVRELQSNLAKKYGVYGFCYYYYWFNGKRLLERPLEEILKSGNPDFPFCICWANENWTRTWDGKENDILIGQKHSPSDDHAFIFELLKFLQDPRYIRIDGKPLILVYKAGLLPDPAQTARIWRNECLAAGIGEIFIACVHNDANPRQNLSPTNIGFDAAVEFPPLGKGVLTTTPGPLLNRNFRGLCYDYKKTADNFLSTPCPPYKFFRGVMPSWDNTARRQDTGTIFLGSTPDSYQHWLESAAKWTARMHVGDERLLFINAWNEWGEGNHLEPDHKFGNRYLDATRTVMNQYTDYKDCA